METFDEQVAAVKLAMLRRDAAREALDAAQVELRDAQKALDEANGNIQAYVRDRVRQGR